MEDENGRYTKDEEEGWSATWGEVASLEDGVAKGKRHQAENYMPLLV